MILNHADADTAVQRKLCPNFKFHLLKQLRKNMILNHAAADTAMPKFQILSSQKLRKNMTNCRETAFHIIYKCRYFTSIRSQIFNNHTIKHNQLFSSDVGGSLSQIIDFINKSKALTKIPKWNKRDLSPNRIIDPNGRKRYKSITSQDTSNTPKKAKL